LSNNNISHITEEAFASLPSLKYLRLSLNKIGVIKAKTFGMLPELLELHLDGNMISSIHEDAFSSLSSLQSLDLSLNEISLLNSNLFMGLVNINHLTVSHNSELSNFPNLKGLTSIMTFDASDTSIEEVPEELCLWTPKIVHLELTSCALTDIPDLSKCSNLKYLYLGSNRLKYENGPSAILNSLSNLLELRTSSTITKELGTVDGSPLGDARLSDLYVPCRADGFSGSGDGFWHQLQTCTCPGGCI
jgi:Leucine-rich repeat (LRR) protein